MEGVVQALTDLANTAHDDGDLTKARALFEQVTTLHRQAENLPALCFTLVCLGRVARNQGYIVKATACGYEALTLAWRLGRPRNVAQALCDVGRALILAGEPDPAAPLLDEALAMWRSLKDTWGTAEALESHAHLAAARSQQEQVVHLFGAASSLWEQGGFPWRSWERSEHTRVLAAIGESVFTRAWESGKA